MEFSTGKYFFGKHILEGMKNADRYKDGIKILGSYTGIILSLEKHLECGEGEERFLKSEGVLAPTNGMFVLFTLDNIICASLKF